MAVAVLRRNILPALMSLFFIISVSVGYAPSVEGSGRDCDDNAVIRCGALTTGELNDKYDNQRDVRVIFNHFGITGSEINEASQYARKGHITKGGRVVVDGKTVATDALTAGRQHMPGSKKVTKNGVTFYTRSPSVSFTQNKLDALVIMKNDKFQYAVLTSCGNPVKATPVIKKEKKRPQPVVETPPPVKEPPPIRPAKVESSAVCRSISVDKMNNRMVSVDINTSSLNAEIIGYSIDFGDGTVITNNINSSGGNPASSGGGYTSSGSEGSTQSSQAHASSSSSVRNMSNTHSSTKVNNYNVNQYRSHSTSTSTAQTSTAHGSSNMATMTHMTSHSGASNVTKSDTIEDITHRYGADGTYIITASLQVRYHDGRTETITSDACKHVVTFETPVTPAGIVEQPAPPQPQPQKELPVTGGSLAEVAGLSLYMAVAGGLGYVAYARIKTYFF